MKVRFCEKCCRMILEGFDFCPYCGAYVNRRPTQDFRATETTTDIAPAEGVRELVSSNERGETPSDSLRGEREGLVLLDRLIQDLENLDAEIANLEIHKL